ncbi:MAG: homoserine O-acetyltransferase [Actinomycetota bacterium]
MTGAWNALGTGVSSGPPYVPGRIVVDLSGHGLPLDGGGRLPEVKVAYETWGRLDDDGANAVLVCHALTGDSHAGGEGGWWSDVVGPGLAIDTDRFHVVCANVLGGCQGTTGPSSYDPTADTGTPYGPDFPAISIRDMVRVQRRLADHLGIDRWAGVVGGSMGGMQVLEWAAMYPERVGSIAVIASTAAASAQQIAWSMTGRRAIELDPAFHGGRYYDRPPGDGPHRGLGVARAVAMIHYRSDIEFERRFGRSSNEDEHPFRLDHRYDVETYLDYHGAKLAERFDANTYLVLNKAMDLHDLGRGRGGMARALDRLGAPALVASVTTDFLYPPRQQVFLREELRARGRPVTWVEIDSPNGHDGFLTDGDQLEGPLGRFLVDVHEGLDR